MGLIIQWAPAAVDKLALKNKNKERNKVQETRVFVNQEHAGTHTLDEKCSTVCLNLFCRQHVSPHCNDLKGFKANILFTHKLVTWPACIFNASERLLGLHCRTETRETLSNLIYCRFSSVLDSSTATITGGVAENCLIKRWRQGPRKPWTVVIEMYVWRNVWVCQHIFLLALKKQTNKKMYIFCFGLLVCNVYKHISAPWQIEVFTMSQLSAFENKTTMWWFYEFGDQHKVCELCGGSNRASYNRTHLISLKNTKQHLTNIVLLQHAKLVWSISMLVSLRKDKLVELHCDTEMPNWLNFFFCCCFIGLL